MRAGTIALAALSSLAGLAATPRVVAGPTDACARLAGASLGAEQIGLPTRGGRVIGANLVAVDATSNRPATAYCKVVAAIAPVDPTAPDIRFELDLPAAWNGKAIMLGGGGFDGVIPDTSGPLLGLPGSAASPLLRGYATFGSDSGHQAKNPNLPTPAVDGAFAVNDEALSNYAGDALKKTHDVAVALIRLHYGRRPSRLYFAGGSNGGREAILAAQRWPADYDGVIAAFPFWQAGTNTLAFGALYRALAAPDAYPDAAKRTLVLRSAISQCDGLDGLKDGLVSDVDDCRFDPGILRCPGGSDAGDACLSDAQISAFRRYASPFFFRRADGGQRRYPAFTALAGAEIADPVVLGTAAPDSPPSSSMPLAALFWDQFVRFAVARDPQFDAGALDPEDPGRYGRRLDQVVDMLNLSPDLKAFQRRGGKLIVFHGLADPLVSHRSSETLRRRLVAAMGSARVADFSRFYVIPGYGHGVGRFEPEWDPLSVLEDWVERGRPPHDLVLLDASAAGRGRGRPLCDLGSWPRYDGHGDPIAAASFRCVSNEEPAP